MVREIANTKHTVSSMFHQKLVENDPYLLSTYVNLWSSLVNRGTWESNASLIFVSGNVPLFFSISDHIEVFISSLSILGIVYDKLIALKLVILGLIIFVLVVINGV